MQVAVIRTMSCPQRAVFQCGTDNYIQGVSQNTTTGRGKYKEEMEGGRRGAEWEGLCLEKGSTKVSLKRPHLERVWNEVERRWGMTLFTHYQVAARWGDCLPLWVQRGDSSWTHGLHWAEGRLRFVAFSGHKVPD